MARSTEQILSCELDKEHVILNLNTGTYYGFENLGAKIWDLISTSKRISKIINNITEEYNVSNETAKKDILNFLEELNNKGLIEISNEKTS